MGSAASNGGAHPFSLLGSLCTSLKAAEFHYVCVPGPDGKMFAHASVNHVCNVGLKDVGVSIWGQLPGENVRLALVSAPHLKISSAKDLFLLYCCNYVPSSVQYG